MPQGLTSRHDWYLTPELRQLPYALRLWIWWCAHGPKRRGSGTIGGNRIFASLRHYFEQFPNRGDNYQAINIRRWNRCLVVDLLDFETYQHTLPLASRGNDEMSLQNLLLEPQSVFVDVGANQGLFSLHASTLIGKAGHILAIEPNPRTAEALRISKSLNKISQMTVIEAAAGNHTGLLEFFVPRWASGVGSVYEAHAGQASTPERIRVKIDLIDRIVTAKHLPYVDLIKVDVEGAEMQVFQGASQTISSYRPFLWFEINPEAQRSAGLTVGALLTYLREQGYGIVLDLSEVVKGNLKLIDSDSTTFLTNVIAVHVERLGEFEDLVKQRFIDRS